MPRAKLAEPTPHRPLSCARADRSGVVRSYCVVPRPKQSSYWSSNASHALMASDVISSAGSSQHTRPTQELVTPESWLADASQRLAWTCYQESGEDGPPSRTKRDVATAELNGRPTEPPPSFWLSVAWNRRCPTQLLTGTMVSAGTRSHNLSSKRFDLVVNWFMTHHRISISMCRWSCASFTTRC